MTGNDTPAAAAVGADWDIGMIMEAIPHRYPFLLIDRIVDMVPGIRATGIKNVSINEPFFQGHFPGLPVMPGVLIVEAMAQTAGCCVVEELGLRGKPKTVLFMSIEGAKFRRPVVPGDQLHVHVAKDRGRGKILRYTGEAKVNGTVAAEATFTAMVRDG